MSTITTFEQMLKAEFGDQFQDWRSRLPDIKTPDAPGGYQWRDLGAITAISVHHAAASATVDPAVIHRFHQSTNGPDAPRPSPGIAYHVYIYLVGKVWKVAYVGDILTIRWHTAGNNSYTFGICAGGNYEAAPPPWEVVNLLQRVITVVRKFHSILGIYKHKDFPNTSTSCPGKAFSGDYWQAVLQTPAPKPPAIKWDKVAYFLEESMRAMEAEGLKAESDQVGKTYLADAKGHRDAK